MAVLRHMSFEKMGRTARRPVAASVSSEPNPVTTVFVVQLTAIAYDARYRQRKGPSHSQPRATLDGKAWGLWTLVRCPKRTPQRTRIHDLRTSVISVTANTAVKNDGGDDWRWAGCQMNLKKALLLRVDTADNNRGKRWCIHFHTERSSQMHERLCPNVSRLIPWVPAPISSLSIRPDEQTMDERCNSHREQTTLGTVTSATPVKQPMSTEP
ncbi:hypothetical protein CMUS01_06307 [Colletotrichum musicola]|uniref:Uncharacterized protein n=1 Tax=Colletotrichum musicola TaxID=2175873 RepID=A0A8H6KM47_9PEZI|nr:hypothetical protein CMUS01_06307 [Colletotrichum musicola]